MPQGGVALQTNETSARARGCVELHPRAPRSSCSTQRPATKNCCVETRGPEGGVGPRLLQIRSGSCIGGSGKVVSMARFEKDAHGVDSSLRKERKPSAANPPRMPICNTMIRQEPFLSPARIMEPYICIISAEDVSCSLQLAIEILYSVILERAEKTCSVAEYV